MESTEGSRSFLLQRRLLRVATDVLRLCRSLPRRDDARTISWQLMRSATSAAANYRAACRCRSRREFVAKVSLTIEECDETDFWLQLLLGIGLVQESAIAVMRREYSEVLAILTVARITARRRLRNAARTRSST